MTPDLFTAIDGPRYEPNGLLLVRIIAQDDRRQCFRCEVVKVLSWKGRTSKPGELITVDAQNLHPYWMEKQ